MARKSAVASIKARADKHAANILPINKEAQRAGATTLRQIAEALNARGVATVREGQWPATSVKNTARRRPESNRPLLVKPSEFDRDRFAFVAPFCI